MQQISSSDVVARRARRLQHGCVIVNAFDVFFILGVVSLVAFELFVVAGFGNFLESGPLDLNLQPRNTTWVQSTSMLYVDQPVGTGYSYVSDQSKLCTNNSQIASDLVSLLSSFLDKHPSFKKLPFFVASESYGGKMTTGFAHALLDAKSRGSIDVNFQGVALGDSWISAVDYVSTWGPFLASMSVLDSSGLNKLTQTAEKCEAAVQNGQWSLATDLWGAVEDQVETLGDGVNFYNVLQHNVPEPGSNSAYEAIWQFDPPTPARRRVHQRHVGHLHSQSLSSLMNGPIRKKLGVIPDNVTWGGQAGAVFNALGGDFMRPVWDQVDSLLSGGKIHVTVYNGQLDLICCTMGTNKWMDRLQWSGMKSFRELGMTPLYPHKGSDHTGAFFKQHETLALYYVLNAGHMAPRDQGDMMLKVIQRIIKNNDA